MAVKTVSIIIEMLLMVVENIPAVISDSAITIAFSNSFLHSNDSSNQ